MKNEIENIFDNFRKYGQETRALLTMLKEANPHVLYPDSLKVGNWEFRKYGTDCYELIVKGENNNRIVADGAALELTIPFPHRWLECFMTHTDNANALSTTSLAFILSRAARSIPDLPIMQDYIFRVFDITVSRPTVSFPPNFKYPRGTYRLALTSATATDFIYPIITIQRLGL